ncbi:MAG: hypothetical protein JOY82_20170 [Streptosporangiaceae bacterium]|nr:hypothetical protein [Streptosporangiaceae bacterium]
MNGMQAALAIATLATFLIGVMLGVVAVVSVVSMREDRRGTFPGEAPDETARGVRRLIAAGSRGTFVPPGGGARR